MSIVLVTLLIHLVAACMKKHSEKSGRFMYLTVLFSCVNIVYFGALANHLRESAVVCLAVLGIIPFVFIIRNRISGFMSALKEYCDIHFYMNIASTVGFFFIYTIQKPLLYYWDEVKIWGQAAASLKYYDRLYSIGINYTNAGRNYPAGNAVLYYFLSFFDKGFTDWHLLFAYAVMFFACYAAVSRAVEELSNDRPLSMIVYVMCLLAPFSTAYHTITLNYNSISYAYGTSMVDYNLAVVFAAVIAMYLLSRKSRMYLLPLMYLITIKKSGIFFAVLAICVIMCFELFKSEPQRKRILGSLMTLVLSAAAVIMTYGGWMYHLDRYAPVTAKSEYELKATYISEAVADPAEDEDMSADEDTAEERRETPRSVSKKDTSPLAILIPSLRTERYNEILDEMKGYFISNRETIFTEDRYLIGALLVLGILMVIFAEKGNKLSLMLIVLGMTRGCFVYGYVISYQMQFYNDMMVEYPRYMLSYYYGWILLIILLGCSFTKKLGVIKRLIMLVLIALVLRYMESIGSGNTVIDSPDNVYSGQIRTIERLSDAKTVLNRGDRVFLVYSSGNDAMLNDVSFRLFPAITNVDTKRTDIDFNAGFRAPSEQAEENESYNIADPSLFVSVMKDYFDYIYISVPDGEFSGRYRELFSDGISEWTLYRITDEDIPMQKVERSS